MLSVNNHSPAERAGNRATNNVTTSPTRYHHSQCLPENPPGNDNTQDIDNVSSGCREINKQNSTSSQRNDSLDEIAEGNCDIGIGDKVADGKINTPLKRRFFDLKRTAESATNEISSNSPSKFALNLTPRLKRKSVSKHKLTQLEQQNNLFIRGSGSELNKHENIMNTAMNRNGAANETQKFPADASKVDNEKSKKSSLIPSFSFKIPPSRHKSDEVIMRNGISGNFKKTGTNLKNLCKNFSTESKLQLWRKLPEEPSSSGIEAQSSYGNYEEIDIINEDGNEALNTDNGRQRNVITNSPDVRNDNTESMPTTKLIHKNMETFSLLPESLIKVTKHEEFNSIVSCKDETLDLSKPEYTSNVFKNIPVRPKKSLVAHIENYCLFDPSVDFCNEKELRKKNFSQPADCDFIFPHNVNFRKTSNITEERAENNAVDHQVAYDVTENDESNSLAHHNYYEIDPELLEQEESTMLQLDLSNSNSINKSIKVKHVNQTSRESSSSSSSCDYPSLFNSVIETTPSSTVESTDDNDSSMFSKMNNIPNVSNPVNNAINQTNVNLVEDDESVITISNTVTATGTTRKKQSPQFGRIAKQSASNLQASDNANRQPTATTQTAKSTKINLPFKKRTFSFDPLKSSHSLPQLQSITMSNRQFESGEFNVVINNTTTIQLRKNVRKVRPLSSDSGFTTPSPPNETHTAQLQNATNISDTNQVINLNSGTKNPAKNESTMILHQCDNIQQLIEVSNVLARLW